MVLIHMLLHQVRDREEAAPQSNENGYAPEHLIVNVAEPEPWLTAGTMQESIFMGRWAQSYVSPISCCQLVSVGHSKITASKHIACTHTSGLSWIPGGQTICKQLIHHNQRQVSVSELAELVKRAVMPFRWTPESVGDYAQWHQPRAANLRLRSHVQRGLLDSFTRRMTVQCLRLGRPAGVGSSRS